MDGGAPRPESKEAQLRGDGGPRKIERGSRASPGWSISTKHKATKRRATERSALHWRSRRKGKARRSFVTGRKPLVHRAETLPGPCRDAPRCPMQRSPRDETSGSAAIAAFPVAARDALPFRAPWSIPGHGAYEQLVEPASRAICDLPPQLHGGLRLTCRLSCSSLRPCSPLSCCVALARERSSSSQPPAPRGL